MIAVWWFNSKVYIVFVFVFVVREASEGEDVVVVDVLFVWLRLYFSRCYVVMLLCLCLFRGIQ